MLSEVNQTQNDFKKLYESKKINNSNTETANRKVALGTRKDGTGQE